MCDRRRTDILIQTCAKSMSGAPSIWFFNYFFFLHISLIFIRFDKLLQFGGGVNIVVSRRDEVNWNKIGAHHIALYSKSINQNHFCIASGIPRSMEVPLIR